jgi:hypothetical protein
MSSEKIKSAKTKMRKAIIAAVIITAIAIWPGKIETTQQEETDPGPAPEEERIKTPEELRPERIKEYLEKKESPLSDHCEKLAEQKHWRLLIAISAIESQFCKRKVAYNCFGIGGDSAYRHYSSYEESIADAEALIERQQAKGRWMTIESMNGTYVVPRNDNWQRVVKKTYDELEYAQ